MNKLCIEGFTNLKIGKNNYISPTAKIYDNVEIGNDNIIYDDVIIYSNTKIGSNNIIHNRNIIGEMPVQSNGTFQDNDYSKTKGVVIGNNNFFHVGNTIFSGTFRATNIKNNNKILSECQIHHDCILNNNIVMYPRSVTAGYCEILDNANIGGCAFIQQRKIVGQNSMVGGGQLVAKNIFPYIVYINNKKIRLNKMKLQDYHLKEEKNLIELANKYYDKMNYNKELLKDEIKNNINNMDTQNDLLYFFEKII